MVRFRVRDRDDRVRVGMVFRVIVWFPVSIQKRGAGGNLSIPPTMGTDTHHSTLIILHEDLLDLPIILHSSDYG